MWSKLIYGKVHHKTQQLVLKRKMIETDAIQNFRNIQQCYQVLRGEVEFLSGERLKEEAMKELDKILDEKGSK